MPDTPSLVLVKRFTYRGLVEEFSNRYHFEGGALATAEDWKVLADAWIQAEKPTVTSAVGWVRAYGYAPGIEHSIVQIDYSVAPNTVVVGTFPSVGTIAAPGDAAITIRWDTNELNSRGKRIYCRKYMHDVRLDTTGAVDAVDDAQLAAMQVYASKIIDGTLPQSVRYSGPQGANLSVPRVDPYITTRTLKRRGKRPLP